MTGRLGLRDQARTHVFPRVPFARVLGGLVLAVAAALFVVAAASAAPPINTVPPSITGALQEGSELTASAGGWNGATTFAYQWQRCSGGGTYSQVVSADNPVGYWRLDEASTTAAVADQTSNGNAGTYNGGVTVPVTPGAITSQPDTAANFNGATGYVKVPSSASLNRPTNGLTIEAWIKPPASQTKPIVLKSYTSHVPPYYQYGLFQSGAGIRLDIATNGMADRAVYFSSGASLVMGSWNHVAATWDGSTVRFYIRGVAAGSSAATGVISTFATPVDFATYENLRGNTAYFWSGVLDEVSIYDRALAAGQISAHFNASAPNTTCSDIAGATNQTYTPTAADVGSPLQVRVTATNGDGSTAATSAQTAAIAPAGSIPTATSPPAISGSAVSGGTLTASAGTWSGGPSTFGYKWQRCDQFGGACVDLAGATGTSYTVTNADIGLRLRVSVAATNSQGTGYATSSPTSRVARSGSTSLQPYEDPVYDAQLTALLLARWPNHYSTAELGLSNYAREAISIRRGLLRARIAAKSMPDMALLPPLQPATAIDWKIGRSFGGADRDTVWLHFPAEDLGFGRLDRVTVQEWCPSGAPPQPDWASPCRRTFSGLWGTAAAWVLAYQSPETPPLHGTQTLIQCDLFPHKCGEPPTNHFRRGIWLDYGPTNDAHSNSTLLTNGYDTDTYHREISTEEMWRRFSPSRFEVYGSQDVNVTVADWPVPSQLNLAAARTVLGFPALANARNWINSQLDPSFIAPVPDTTTELLEQWAPELRYDSTESYWAVSAASIANSYVAGQQTNRLLDSAGGVIASSDPAEEGATLTLDYLNDPYPGNVDATPNHRLDEENGTRKEDADRYHGHPDHGNRMYGRVVSRANGEKTLQYWFFYYYQPSIIGIGEHEGDWEMIQVDLNAQEAPIRVTAAQHTGGERCDYNYVRRTPDSRPILYPARKTHATFFSTGPHLYDIADGAGFGNTPTLVNVTAWQSIGWLLWPGHWGNEGDAPGAPREHTSWEAPEDWSWSVSDCSEEQEYPARPRSGPGSTRPEVGVGRAAPPLPRLVADRSGRRLVVRYRFASTRSRAPKPWHLELSLVPPNALLPPKTVTRPVTGQTGSTTLRIADRRPALVRLLARVVSKNGRGTKTVSVPIE